MSGLLEMSIRNVRFALELKISLACISFYMPTVIIKKLDVCKYVLSIHCKASTV